jgi:hypothetical protein
MHRKPKWLVEVPTGPAWALITLLAIPLAGAPSWGARVVGSRSSHATSHSSEWHLLS